MNTMNYCLKNIFHSSLIPLFWFISIIESVNGVNPKQYHLGAVLSSTEQVKHFEKIIDEINHEGGILPHGVTLKGHSILKRTNPIDDTINFCHNLMPFEISAIIIDDLIPADAITFTSSLHNIPTIGLANRECIFSDKSLYGSYMRTTPTYSNQADVWIQLLTHFEFECAHFIVSDSINGRNIKTRFIELADSYNLDIESVIEYDFAFPSLIPDLEAIKERNSSCRINVLFVDYDNAVSVLRQIIALNMTGTDSVWLVSEQALTAPNLPLGFIGVRYKDWSNIQAHIIDSVYVISNAIKEMHDKVNFTMPPSDCRNIGRPKWVQGDILYDYLREQTIIFGKTGKISFDERGDRMNGDYEILNQQIDFDSNYRLANVGHYFYNQTVMKMQIDIQEENLVWPGNKTEKPIGYSTPAHLRIVTLAEIPFVWVVPTNKFNGCDAGQVPCPIRKKNPKTNQYYQEDHCCEGYCIDLLIQLATQLNFTYTLNQVEDGLYGSYSFNRKTGHHEWTGLLGELYYGRADMVVAALTITPERSQAIDFTKPFKYQGITILQKQQAIHRLGHPLTSFLQPFQNSLWVSVFVAVHVVALALYLLDRFSPFGRYKLPNCESITEEDALNLSSAIWFAWGVLFNSGIGEGTPRSFSGRVLGMVWAGFAMIIVASYTANLAAFLVLDRPQTALSGINDPRLRTPPEGFNYSTVRHSAVDNYFKRQVELAPMHKRMSEIFYDNVEEAIAAVKSGSLSAFIWDTARLEYEAANDCELIISGEHFGRSGYAIGLPKEKIYWKDKVTLALLGMHESGFMEDLDNKWILLNEQVCAIKPEQFPPTLGLKNMAGVFILVATGILGGVGLIMFEIFYKQHQTRKQKRMELARNALDRWKEMVQKNKLRKESLKIAAQQRYKDQQTLHRRRQQLRHSSKSMSDERSTSSSIEMERCNNLSYGNDSETDRIRRPPKPTHLELTHINTAALPTTSRRMDQEQHPVASARIHYPGSKPKLRREFSVAYEPPETMISGTISVSHSFDDPGSSRTSSKQPGHNFGMRKSSKDPTVTKEPSTKLKIRSMPGDSVAQSADPLIITKYAQRMPLRKLLFTRSLLKSQIEQINNQEGALPVNNAKNLFDSYKIDYRNKLHERPGVQMFQAQNTAAPEFIMMACIHPIQNLDPNNSFYLKILRHLGRKHPYIIHTWEIFHDNNNIIIFQEFVTKGNLVTYLENNEVDEKQVCFWAKQIFRALDFLGDNGIAHRSITPTHLVVKAMGDEIWIKLTGFYHSIIYWKIDENDVNFCPCLPLSQQKTDGASFQAPEVYGNPNEFFDPILADIWSYGANLFYSLTKYYPYNIEHPHDDLDEEISHNISKITNVSQECRTFLLSLLRSNANDRMPFDFIDKDDWIRQLFSAEPSEHSAVQESYMNLEKSKVPIKSFSMKTNKTQKT